MNATKRGQGPTLFWLLAAALLPTLNGGVAAVQALNGGVELPGVIAFLIIESVALASIARRIWPNPDYRVRMVFLGIIALVLVTPVIGLGEYLAAFTATCTHDCFNVR